MRFALLFSISLAVLALEIPAGTDLQIRLSTPLSTATAKSGQAVNAILIAPILSGGEVAIPGGTKVSGRVKEVKRSADRKEQALLLIEFQTLGKANISARVTEVDNARETVDAAGRIVGVLASQSASSRLDQGIGKIAQRFPELGGILGAAKSSIVEETDPNIVFEAGAEMTLRLSKPVAWKGALTPVPLQPVLPAEDLAELVNRLPMRTMAASPRRPSDLTNLLFLGRQQDLEKAFQDAGWSTAAELSSASKLETFRAIVEMRGYKEAPVSTLLLEGEPPSLVFQKQNNTFAQRHHLRIWRRPERFEGKDVWVCAATHDVGIDFSQEHHTFIHRVDPHIDVERAKVAADLLLTGLVKGLSLVDRPGIPKDGTNATGDPFITDGRMAVIAF